MGSFNTPIPPGGGGGGPSGAAAAGVSRAAAGFAQQQQQHQYQHQQQQQPVAILWDIENCPVPGEMNPEEVAGNVRMALGSMHSSFRGAVTKFSAYGDFNHFPRKVREGCHRTGINLNDVPNSKKNASDKAILVDMFLFALDNPPPCTILLITGDVDFAPALHKLGQRGYTVVLAIPSGYVSGSLCSAGRFVWDWASVARGHGLVPAKTMTQSGSFQQRDNPEQTQRFLPGVMFSDESGDEGFKAAAPIPVPQVSHGYSMGFASQSSGEWGFLHHPPPPPPPPPMQQSPGHWTHPTTSMPSSSSAVPVEQETLDDPGSPGGKSHTSFVQPGDLSGLKRQLVKLLSLHGGKMLMNKVPPEYCKFYGRPLYIAEYGSRRLVHLIEKMQDTVCIKGEGTQRRVQLTSTGKRMAGRYKKLWGSACKSTGKNAVFDDDDDDDDDGDGDGDGDERENEVEEQEVDSREAPKEESKSMVDEELVVYVSKLDVSHESDSGASPDDQGSEQQQEAEEVIEIQEVVESSSSSGSGGGGGGGAASAAAAAAAAAREGFKRELQELLVSFQYHIPVSEFLRLYRQRYCKEPEYAAFGVDNLEELLEKIKDVAVLKGRIPEKRVMVANVGFVETED